MPVDDSQGTVLTFAGTTYEATNLDLGGSVAMLDAAHLGQAKGSMKRTQAAPLKDPRKVTLSILGTVAPVEGASGVISLVSYVGGVTAQQLTGATATCESFNITWQTNELVKGQATFTVVQ
jgi:hypothetical protein